MIRLLAGTLALVLPTAAMAQETEKAAEEIIIPARVVSREEIVVSGSGLLRESDSDLIQSSNILLDVKPGLGARIENRLRD
ncbi:MAG: TonB-dependent receptor, partial [Sphingopyxis sp.]|nr:TonB-dependent receptor [Sphingopyxis sp.]